MYWRNMDLRCHSFIDEEYKVQIGGEDYSIVLMFFCVVYSVLLRLS